MPYQSLLLAVDGSQESLFASDIASTLASTQEATLTVQTVVDTHAIWNLVGQDLPGIIGSGPYISIKHSIEQDLRSLAETLITAYQSRIEGKEIVFHTFIDEGDVAEEICTRAKMHDLLIIGHRAYGRNEKEHRNQRRLCQHVAEFCSTPLLIVQRATALWSKSQLLVSSHTYSQSVIQSFIKMTALTESKAEIICTGLSKSLDELVSRVHSDLALTMPVSDSKIQVTGKGLHEIESMYTESSECAKDTLVVLTTYDTASGRKMCTGEALNRFIGELSAFSTMILPPTKVEAAKKDLILTSLVHS